MNLPRGGIVVGVLSRVVEKSSAFTLCVLEQVLTTLEALGAFDGVDTVLFRSDPGPHYRCNRVLTTMGNRWVQRLRKANCTNMIKVRARFGCEHHAKNGVDRTFAGWSQRLRRYEKHSQLHSIENVITCFRLDAADRHPSLPVEYFYDFMPVQSKHDFEAEHPLCVARSLPAPIKSVYEYSFTCADVRRVDLVGRDGVTVEGVHARARRLPGMGSTADLNSKLVIRRPDDAGDDEEDKESDEEHDDEPPMVDRASLVPMGTSHYLGWRTSYRKEAPEMPNRVKTLRRLQQRAKFFKDVDLPKAQRCARERPGHVSVQRQRMKLARQKAERLAFAAKRGTTRIAAKHDA